MLEIREFVLDRSTVMSPFEVQIKVQAQVFVIPDPLVLYSVFPSLHWGIVVASFR
jgi:hypothetical protein